MGLAVLQYEVWWRGGEVSSSQVTWVLLHLSFVLLLHQSPKTKGFSWYVKIPDTNWLVNQALHFWLYYYSYFSVLSILFKYLILIIQLTLQG